MKQIKYYMLAGVAMMMLLGSCSEDNSMTEINQDETSNNDQDAEKDEVVQFLSAIPNVYNVELEFEKNTNRRRRKRITLLLFRLPATR